MISFASLLFGFQSRVDRRLYFSMGSSLMLLKYIIDASVIGAATGRFWTPVDYLAPLITLRATIVDALPSWLIFVLVLWTLPFIWIGVSMTMRRAVDAGRSPWWCLAFFVPGVNYITMLWLSTAPSAANVDWDTGPVPTTVVDQFRSAAAGLMAAIIAGVLAVSAGVLILEAYGLAMFVATPIAIGVVSAYVYNQRHARTSRSTIQVVALSLFAIAGSIVLFAIEGLLCIAMALPLGGWSRYSAGRSAGLLQSGHTTRGPELR